MYDDIAYNIKNPHKGKIINYKGGPNVYPGVPHDYTKKDVIVKNFFKFLRGENMTGIGSGKSLESGPNDRIFIYFADHGGPGIICFPGMVELHVQDLMDTFKYMHENNMYKEMIFYMEACESGSMWDGFSVEDLNIYAVTASNPSQSSYACDHDILYLAYLNDCWSRNYMNDTRWALKNEQMDVRTFEEQFQWVKKQTTQSPECRYGNLDYAKYTLNVFQGQPSSTPTKRMEFPLGYTSDDEERVVSYDVPLRLLEKNVELNPDNNALKNGLKEYMAYREDVDNQWNSFAEHFKINTNRPQGDADTCHRKGKFPAQCMKSVVEATKKFCGSFDDYSAKYYWYLYKACDQGLDVDDVHAYWSKNC